MTATSTTYDICLYAEGLFARNDDKINKKQCTALQNSGFTTVIIWALHVNAAGDLQFADDPVVRNGVFSNQYNFMARWINELKSSGSVTRVLLSIGGWAVGDFSNMFHLLNETGGAGKFTLTQNFEALVTALPIDGFDFDLEEWGTHNITDDQYVDTIVTLTGMLSGIGGGMAITYCPYDHQEHWLAALQQVYAAAGRQLVSAYNLQCYSGGLGNDPAAWAGGLTATGIAATGIENPAAFVIPGYACYGAASDTGSCPGEIQSTFAGLFSSDPGITGGFIWKSSALFANENSHACSGSPMTPTAYDTAVSLGLQGNSG